MSFTTLLASTGTITPPMVSPTSVSTSPPHPTLAKSQERRPKLRASCDACATSKVKCSKTHPICVRCSANGSQCVYGVSKKHGKPGRTRKRNPDGSPFVKASKKRLSPYGGEFSKFRVCAEPLLPDVSDIETAEWPSTPSWPPMPDFDYEVTLDPMFSDPDYFNFMGHLQMASPASHEHILQTIESDQLTFRDPFAKMNSTQQKLSFPADFQAVKDYVGGKSINVTQYSFEEANVASFFSDWSDSPQKSPNHSDSFFGNLRTSSSVPAPHNCYNLACITLESLQCQTSDTQSSMPSNIELKSLDSVLSVTKTAVQNVVQLLACPCSSDPHLAILYSSIASRIINWYQVAAGIDEVSTHIPALATSSSSSQSPFAFSSPSCPESSWSSPTLSSLSTASIVSSPLKTPSPTNTTFNIKPQPLKIGLFELDDEVQESLRRQVVLRELKRSSTMIDSLANWSREGESEQAEFLYDVLGAWLKSELYKTLREVKGKEHDELFELEHQR